MLTRILTHRWLRWVLVAATCAAMFWLNLGGSSLWDPDEGRHAEIAREMLVSGNWLTPTLGFQPYHDKPILFYWLGAATMYVFGSHEWAIRLPSATAACLGVAATTWWASRYLGVLTGTLAGLILATAGMYVVLARFVLLDMLFASWMTAAFLYGSAWCLEGRLKRWPLWPFYVLLALAMLTKGPVAPVLAVLTFWPFLYRLRLRPTVMRPVFGLLVIGLVAGSWYLAALVVAPDYMAEFLIGHNVERFATGSVGHRMNAFAYLYLLPLSFLPWTLYLPALGFRARASRAGESPLSVEFAALWLGLVLLFFSVSAAKLATYLLPVFPPLAILAAAGLAPVVRRLPLAPPEEVAHRWAYWGFAVLVLVAPFAAYVFLKVFAPGAVSTAAWLCLGAPVVLFGLGAVRARRYDLALTVVFLLTVQSIVVFYERVMPALDDVYSLKTPAALLSHPSDPPPRVVTLEASGNSFAFYGGCTVEKLDDLAQAADLLAGERPVLIVTKRRLVEPLQHVLQKPAYVWWENAGRRALIGNQPPLPGSSWHVRQLPPLLHRVAHQPDFHAHRDT